MLDLTKNEAVWLEQMLNKANMVTSYKAFWFKGILEEVYESGSSQISFDRIVCRMIAEAWYPLIQYRLNFGVQDLLQRTVDYLEEIYQFGVRVNKTQLVEQLYYADIIKRDSKFQKMKKGFYDMVPYRLINPFFSQETRGVKDQRKNRLIAELAMNSDEVFYKIVLIETGERCIQLEDRWLTYLTDNYMVIKGWLENKLVVYLQAKNPSVPSIPMKLERRRARHLSRAKDYWMTVNLHQPVEDIYTSKLMIEQNYSELGAFSLDHFVPWSFVMHDNLWNIIPTFKDVNSAKNDRLPNLDKYLESYCMNHYQAFTYMKGKSENNVKIRRYLEDYLNVGGRLNSEEILHRDIEVGQEVFVDTLKQAIYPIYQIAYNQGFEVWEQ